MLILAFVVWLIVVSVGGGIARDVFDLPYQLGALVTALASGWWFLVRFGGK
jgi:uncharacterized membrane protein YkvI